MFKSNKRRILSIFIMVLALIVLVPSFALSYFYFNTPSNNNTIIGNGSVNHGIDDIEENYTGGKDDSSKEYTIYFFPSTLYAQIGYEHEVNPSNVKPEDVFGYVEYTYDEESGSGRLSNPYNEHVSNSKYTMNNQSGDVGYFDYVSNSVYTTRNLYNNKDSYVHSFDNGSNPDNIDEYWASWVIFQTDIGSKTYYNYNLDTVKPTNPNAENLESARQSYEKNWNRGTVYNHYRFRNDRLGYWPNLEYHSGRYLPIKIEVTDYLPSYVYDDMNLIPFTDMGDSSPMEQTWYNFAFAGWGYFNSDNTFTARSLTNLSNTNEPNYMKDSFTAADLTTSTFDIMNDLSSYADENGVIRLYPIFSNGKNYAAQVNHHPNYEDARTGGRDAIRLKFEYNSDSLNERLYSEEQYFLYEEVFGDEDPSSWFNNDPPVVIASIKNLELKLNDIQSLSIYCDGIGQSGSGWWSGTWYNFFPLIENGDFRYPILNNYGEGVYNFYIFLLEPSLYRSSKFDFDKYSSDNVLYNYLLTSIEDNRISSLINKKIDFLVTSPVPISDNTSLHSKALVAIEKVTESKFIDNLNIDQNISTQTSSNYRTSLSMLRFEDNVGFANNLSTSGIRFGDDIYDNSVITDILTDKLRIDTGNLKTISNDDLVLLRNVDFTNYSSLLESAFQIRLYEKYQSEINFVETSENDLKLNEDSSVSSLEAMVFNSENDEVSYDDIFIDASYYFDLVEAGENITINDVTYKVDQRVYVPRNSVYLGKYDFLLYHDRNKDTYKLYAYRHSNIHIYVFSGDQEDTNNDGYVDMNNNELLWERRTTIGSYAEPNDLGTKGPVLSGAETSSEEISFHNMINAYLDSLGDKNKTYYVRDHVTGIDLFEINHDGSVWKINKSLDNFRIRKSYIFYITDEVNTNN